MAMLEVLRGGKPKHRNRVSKMLMIDCIEKQRTAGEEAYIIVPSGLEL